VKEIGPLSPRPLSPALLLRPLLSPKPSISQPEGRSNTSPTTHPLIPRSSNGPTNPPTDHRESRKFPRGTTSTPKKRVTSSRCFPLLPNLATRASEPTQKIPRPPPTALRQSPLSMHRCPDLLKPIRPELPKTHRLGAKLSDSFSRQCSVHPPTDSSLPLN